MSAFFDLSPFSLAPPTVVLCHCPVHLLSLSPRSQRIVCCLFYYFIVVLYCFQIAWRGQDDHER
ncbi:hypothetical protein BKA57DRAFT_453327 [Linnemannia elongata]|nr:hypothetical protein BKA57DRAFT_453327 [Linnemannia elongata]